MSQRSFASAENATKEKRTRREKFLADEALEDALYDSQALRDFAGCDAVRRAAARAVDGGPWRCWQLDANFKWARLLEKAEQLKASIRAKVEHPFHVIKNLFGHKKVRYKGLAKNEAQLFSLFGLANLVIAKRSLLALDARGAARAPRAPSQGAQTARKGCCASCEMSH